MKKRNLFLIIGLAFSLSACGGSTSEPSSNTDETTIQETAASETSEEVAADLSVEQQTIFDQDGITVSVTGITEDSLFGPELNLLIENNSEKNITVQARKSAINGYMISSTMSSDVASGKKANDTLSFSSSELETCGIDTIANIEFSLHIFDPDTFDTLYDSDLIKLNTNMAEGFSQTYDNSGETLYDENGIKIVYKGLSTDGSILGPEVIFYAENNTDQVITIQARDTSVNGFMIDPSLSTEITPGNRAVSGMTFLSSQLEENNIADFETVETSFHIFDDNYNTIVDTAPIVITIQSNEIGE